MFGFLNINKPSGPTSHDIVGRARRRFPRGVKIGHAGTLDPRADGVLVLCVGPAARLADRVQAFSKRYLVVLTLGAVSTTDDTEGLITPTPGAVPPAEQAVRDALPAFLGDIQQVPPDFSAVHVDGHRAYKAARAGRPAAIAPRGVTIHAIDLVDYAWPLLTLDVCCGSGTYIRSLARDLGRVLGVGAYARRLTRTQVGPFTLADALAGESADMPARLLSPLLALPDTPRVALTDEQVVLISRGRHLPIPPDAPTAEGPLEVALVDPGGNLVALANLHARKGRILPAKVFVPDPGLGTGET